MLKKYLKNREKLNGRQSFLVLGIVGKRASGKDLLTRYLVNKYRGKEIIFSRYILQALQLFWLPEDRDSIAWLIGRVRRRFDKGILSKVAIEAIKKQLAESRQSFFILNGMRVWREIVLLKKEFGSNFVLVYINSSDEQRWRRIKKREESQHRQKDKLQTSVVDFIEQEKKILTEKEVPSFENKADFIINNLRDQESFIGEAEKIVAKIIQKKGL